MNKLMILGLLVGGLVSQNSFGEATFTNYCVDKNGETISSDKPCSEIGLKEKQFALGLNQAAKAKDVLIATNVCSGGRKCTNNSKPMAAVAPEGEMHTLPYFE